jgi:DNA-binding SARP family transcriptional activator
MSKYMGVMLKNDLSLTELEALINQVPAYPITAKQLIELGEKQGAAQAVIDFYRTFPPNELFEDKDDLLARSESLLILRRQTAPAEEMHAPEED